MLVKKQLVNSENFTLIVFLT